MYVYFKTDLLEMHIKVAPAGNIPRASLEIELLNDVSTQRKTLKRLADEQEEEILIPHAYVATNSCFAVVANKDSDLYLYVIEDVKTLPSTTAEWKALIESRLALWLSKIPPKFRERLEIEQLWCPDKVYIM